LEVAARATSRTRRARSPLAECATRQRALRAAPDLRIAIRAASLNGCAYVGPVQERKIVDERRARIPSRIADLDDDDVVDNTRP
jgi:hypothetical protein